MWKQKKQVEHQGTFPEIKKKDKNMKMGDTIFFFF